MRWTERYAMAEVACMVYHSMLDGNKPPENLNKYPMNPVSGKPFLIKLEERRVIIFSEGSLINLRTYYWGEGSSLFYSFPVELGWGKSDGASKD